MPSCCRSSHASTCWYQGQRKIPPSYGGIIWRYHMLVSGSTKNTSNTNNSIICWYMLIPGSTKNTQNTNNSIICWYIPALGPESTIKTCNNSMVHGHTKIQSGSIHAHFTGAQSTTTVESPQDCQYRYKYRTFIAKHIVFFKQP